MKKLLSVFVFLCLTVKLFSQENDFLSIKELTFNETKYVLATATQKSKVLYVQDYILEDERIEDASQLISIYFFNKPIDAKDAATSKIKELDARKNTDKYCTYNLTESPNGTEFVVDYITSNVPKSKEEPIPNEESSDYNIYRFRNVMNGDKSVFMIIAYKENFTGDTKNNLKAIAKKRNKLMEGIITLTIPEITLKTN
jgi:hypothetical protein